jgi:hypothetical protein
VRRYRVTVEVEMPDESSADDVLVWANKILAIGKNHWDAHDQLDSVASYSEQRVYRVISAAPVRESLFK